MNAIVNARPFDLIDEEMIHERQLMRRVREINDEDIRLRALEAIEDEIAPTVSLYDAFAEMPEGTLEQTLVALSNQLGAMAKEICQGNDLVGEAVFGILTLDAKLKDIRQFAVRQIAERELVKRAEKSDLDSDAEAEAWAQRVFGY